MTETSGGNPADSVLMKSLLASVDGVEIVSCVMPPDNIYPITTKRSINFVSKKLLHTV